MPNKQNVDSVNEKKFHFSYYVGVMRSTNLYTRFTQYVLSHFIGDTVDTPHVNCTGPLHDWMLLG